MGFVPIYNALTRPWPNDVYSVSADGMNIRVNGTLGSGDGGPFALRVASAVVRMWSATDDRPLVVELNSGGGSAGAAEMMAYSLFLANKLIRQGTTTVVGRNSYQRRVKTSTGRVLDESWPPVELGGGIDPVRIVCEIAAPLCQDLIEIG